MDAPPGGLQRLIDLVRVDAAQLQHGDDGREQRHHRQQEDGPAQAFARRGAGQFPGRLGC
ncbi:hypothetical protein ACLESD_28660 [Pyxidicoccus sp. 3LFB2]